MTARRLVVVALRGSGGALTHLRETIPRLMRLQPAWSFELYAPPALLHSAFGSASEAWMRPVEVRGYAGRSIWELARLSLLASRPNTVIYAPFGPHGNLACMGTTVWAARNIIPLTDPASWEVSRAERPRLHVLRAVFRFGARLGRRVICVSHHARAQLLALSGAAPDAIAVVPHGADGALRRPPLSETPVADLAAGGYVLSVGQPTPYRRTRELIQAYELLSRRRSIPPLVLVGESREIDARYGRECKVLARDMLRDGRLRMLGQRAPGETLTMTAHASVVAYPSVHEDCPNVVLEALGAGRVLVCADIAATRELAADAAVLLRDPQPAALAGALERALFDLPLRAKLQSAAPVRASRFTWDHTAEATAEVLDRAFRRS